MKTLKFAIFTIIFAELTMYLMIAGIYNLAFATFALSYLCLNVSAYRGARQVFGLHTYQ